MPEPSFAVRLRDTSVTAIATVIGAVLTLIGIYFTGWFAYASKDEELRSHLVEVALGILREDPKGESDDMKKVRVWAIRLRRAQFGRRISEGGHQGARLTVRYGARRSARAPLQRRERRTPPSQA